MFDKEMIIRSGLLKNEDRNTVKVTDEDGAKTAVTIVRPVTAKNGFSLVEIELITGRTHQIRVHLSEKGFPLIGDPKYGDPRDQSTHE